MRTSVTFEIKGDFQKPGFKPFFWKIASGAGLGGWIADSDDAIRFQLDGEEEVIRAFIRPLPATLAPHYTLREITVLSKKDHPEGEPESVSPFRVYTASEIEWNVRPDRAPCPDCIKEIMDPESRRYCYPFWSCGDCGSNYSAMLRNPFRRQNTALSAFPPCTKCRNEALDENDVHHVHSELLACPDCGPQMFLLDSNGDQVNDSRCICTTQQHLKEGKIIALQSMFGGFRLFADGTNPQAIRELRRRTKVPARPIGVMARNMEAVHRICYCSKEEEELLCSPAAPIVILRIREEAREHLALEELSNAPMLAITLPATLTMHLLFKHTGNECGHGQLDYLGMITSTWSIRFPKNTIDELIQSLRGVADTFLCHDLNVAFVCPASVAVVRDGTPQIWRRSKGYAPEPLRLKQHLRQKVAAFGYDTNATVALATGTRVITSQHLGDVLSAESVNRLTEIMHRLITLFDTVPEAVACDINTGLNSSQEAARFAEQFSLPLIHVHPHHAQAIAGMSEHGLTRALSVIFDPGEKSSDGMYWGAELLDADFEGFRRLGTFCPAGMPGSENAVTRPVRQLVGRLLDAGVELTPALLERFRISEVEADVWRKNCSGQGRILYTHSATRLFDAVSAGLGAAPEFCTYPNQSCYSLEYAAMRAAGGLENVPGWMYDKFNFDFHEGDSSKLMIDWKPLFRNFSDPDWIKPEFIPQLALAFHAKIADSVAAMVHYGAERTGVRDVVLSGSMFMNQFLLELVTGKLRAEKYNVFIHRQVPLDESCICIGQAIHAGMRTVQR